MSDEDGVKGLQYDHIEILKAENKRFREAGRKLVNWVLSDDCLNPLPSGSEGRDAGNQMLEALKEPEKPPGIFEAMGLDTPEVPSLDKPTDTDTDDIEAAFERWATEKDFPTDKDDNGAYVFNITAQCFAAYKAGKES
jgi:hypothetical protein